MDRVRIKGLDGLRAIAIMGVVAYHMLPEVFPGGLLGVVLFFVLMGYLMVYSVKKDIFLNNNTDADIDINLGYAWNYYKKKIKRIYPALLITIIVVLLVVLIAVPKYSNGSFKEITSVILGYNNWWQIFQNTSYLVRMSNSSPFTHLWYIGLTVQYYILWPFLIWVADRIYDKLGAKTATYKKHVLMVSVLLLAIVSGLEMSLLYNPELDPSRLYYGTDTRAFSILLGMFIGMISIDGDSSKKKKILARIACVILMAVVMGSYILVDGSSAFNFRFMMQSISAVFALIVLCVLIDQDFLGKVLEWRPLKLVGKYSYEIYLVMYPVIFVVQKREIAGQNRLAYAVLCFVLIMACAYGLKKISKYVVQLIEQKKFVKYKINFATLALVLVCIGISLIQTHIGHNKASDAERMQRELLAQQEAIQMQNEKLNENNINQITCIGDSVMLGSAEYLQQNLGAYVDAKVSRQVGDGADLAKQLKEEGTLGGVVVVHLGTNGVSKMSEYQRLVDNIGNKRQIYWVNCHGVDWKDSSNEIINKIVEDNENVHLIDWDAASRDHEEYFFNDGIHLNDTGRKAYTKLIQDSIK